MIGWHFAGGAVSYLIAGWRGAACYGVACVAFWITDAIRLGRALAEAELEAEFEQGVIDHIDTQRANAHLQ